jgi:hypothetical protein
MHKEFREMRRAKAIKEPGPHVLYCSGCGCETNIVWQGGNEPPVFCRDCRESGRADKLTPRPPLGRLRA